MITSDEDGSGAKAPPPLITQPLSSIMKKQRQNIESNRQLSQRYFDTLVGKYASERKWFVINSD